MVPSQPIKATSRPPAVPYVGGGKSADVIADIPIDMRTQERLWRRVRL